MSDIDYTDRKRFPKPDGMTEEEYRTARQANREFASRMVEDAMKKLQTEGGWSPFVDPDNKEKP